MPQFIIDQSFWNLFPQAKIGVLLLKNYQNSDQSSQEIVQLLEESLPLSQAHLTEDVFSDNPVIQVYRKAYQQFKTKKGARSSIEALLKRVSGNNPVRSINPLVDIYNAASLRYALPVGAEDLDTFVGDLQLTITEGGDEFYLIGDDTNQPTLPGELCYKDQAGAVCRCFNWRDGERTMITDQTKNAFLVI
ncbi:TPA: B3/4 domain-containing protein, partial [Streptococcus suis]